jgi:tight adherence protein B
MPLPLADAAQRGAEATGVSARVAAMLERAGWAMGIGDFLAAAILLALVGGLSVGVLQSPILGAVTALVLLVTPFVVLSAAGRKRLGRIQGQLPDVLTILASSLRAGHSFLQALDSVAQEIDEPAASEFARTLSEIRLGRKMDDALTALAARAGGQDLEWAVTAINIQRKVGGNLAEVLETVASTIRERQTIRRQVKVLSAEGRMSVWILFALPFGIASYLGVVNPEYLSVLTATTRGHVMLAIAGVLMLVGLVWMRKVVRLDV